MMWKAVRHFQTITAHKLLVMRYCFRVGLYRQGLLHDLSKYSYTEFRVGARYYQGNRSPNAAEIDAIGYSTAWLHHKGRNKHHFEYWIDFAPRSQERVVGVEMPVNYVAEMLMDRIAACRVYQGEAYTDRSPLEYYELGKNGVVMHARTKALLEQLLTMLAEKGEEETLRYVKQELLPEARRSGKAR